ncbi:MAG: GDSL-type esterase/lipase family protein [Candidatus Nanohaloarchaea archaeon]|nr:GDSL-type esterase/lipase family protein [Candidatus Nanohaloarchaea archaeon]
MAQFFVFGNSIAWGCWDERGGWAERIRAALNREARRRTSFYAELYNLSVTGDTVVDIASRMERETRARRSEDAEHVVGVLAAGLNDAQVLYGSGEPLVMEQEFRNRLDDLYSTASGLFDDVLVVGLTPVDEDRVHPIPWKEECAYTRERRELFDTIVEEKTDDYGLRYVDPLGGTSIASFRSMLEDGVHPDEDGHVIVLQQVLPVVRELL